MKLLPQVKTLSWNFLSSGLDSHFQPELTANGLELDLSKRNQMLF
ncbi:unnamed protein product [Coffea canephora]|uniref:DH200=94 genomic scaffold, scaffold_304 n=1 Tax=Coffea canephora TaxID=49390 RepID=A0A068VDT2_COFCA|nr:unnamed protein product [Coffea canephora]